MKQNIEGVLWTIEKWIEEHTPGPSQEGNGYGTFTKS